LGHVQNPVPILPRYFLRIFLPLFGLSLAVFTGVLMMNHFLRLFNLAVMKGISPLWIGGCFARLLPFILSLAVPMSFVVALLLTFGQLAEGGEIMALRSCGFSFFDMTWPLLVASLLLSGSLLYLNHKASPEGYHSFRNQYAMAVQQVARVDLEPNTFLQMGPWKLYARSVDPDTGRLEGVYFVRIRGSSVRIEAKRGQLTVERGRGVRLQLEDGDLLMPNPDPTRLTSGRFQLYTVEVPTTGGFLPARNLDIQEMNSFTLRREILAPQTEPLHRIEYAVEIAMRSASALSPLIFFWIGAPLGLTLGRQSRSRGFAIALGVLFAFYGLTALGIGLGRRRASLASAAPWIPDVVGAALGVYFTRRISDA
jgi:lipopolysaccharide export LptBFGC system permease protein LptF